MTSLLATQLNRLSIPEGQLVGPDSQRHKSLLYSKAELNKVDAAAHLERAQKAFRHLVNIDGSLEQFYNCFFSEERIDFEPTMQTPKQRAVLDQFVEHFLMHMSQHLLLGFALEVLEWLVYRFHIHLYNMDAMLQAVFPYHSTNLFPKFLQLFEFTANNKRWHWLKPLANQGLPLVKSELVRMAARDEAILNFSCNLVVRALKVFGPDESRLSLFVNQYSQVALGVLMTPIDGQAFTKCVNSLNFYIIKGLRSSLSCYRHSAYQVVQLLATKHQLNPTVLNIWMRRLLKSSCKYEPNEVCLLIALVCKMQKSTVPLQLTSKFESLCEQSNSTVLNDFPEIVGRDTTDVDIIVQQPQADKTLFSDDEEEEKRKAQLKQEQREQKRRNDQEQREQLEASICDVLLADRSPLTTVACLLTLLTSHSDTLRHSALDCLSAASKSATVGDEEDASIWSLVNTVLATRQAIERDSQAVLRPEVAEAAARLLWRSMGDLLPQKPVTALQRHCLLAHLQFFNESGIRLCLQDGEESSVRLLSKLVNYSDKRVAVAAASKVTPSVFSAMSPQQKTVYLTEGLSSSKLTEEPHILKLASAYSVETEIYTDCLAELFGLVPSNPSIRNLSNRRKTCSSGNAYLQMDESTKLRFRFLLKLILISEAVAFEEGLQLVIKLMEVLKVLVQAYSQSSEDSGVARDICLCLVCSDKVAGLSESDSGLADQVPAQTVLDCARTVQNRQCQYAGIGLLCRLCERAPSCVSRCFAELVQFLVDTKFFNRCDAHTEQLWKLLLESAVPSCADGISLLRQLLIAYPDVPPSRRVELYRQAVVALNSQEHLWKLLLLLNLRAADDSQRPREFSTGRKRRLSEQSDLQYGQFDQLGSSVLATFEAPLQLSSCATALDCLLGALDHRQFDAFDSRLALPNEEEELAGLLGGTLALVTSHLTRKDLLIGIASDESSAGAMTRLLRSLVDCLLWSSGSQQYRMLAAAAVRAIERAETAVPGALFLQVVTELLANEDHGVQRKALDLLLGKLSGLDKVSAVKHLRQPLLTCLHSLDAHVGSQVGLICAKELTRLLGSEEARLVTKFCKRASQRCLQFDSPNWELAGCCLLVNAEAIKQAGVALLPVVVQAFPPLLDCLQKQQPPQVALLAAYAFIQQCVLSLCDLLVPYLPHLIPVTVHYLEDGAPQPQLAQKLRSVLTRLARCVEFGQLAPIVLRCANIDTRHPGQYARLLRVSVESAMKCAAEQADSVEEFESELSDVFARLLSVREQRLEQEERGVVQQLARCLLLLPKSLQSSLLQSLLDWCTNVKRQLPLYRMLQLGLSNSTELSEILVDLEVGQKLALLLEARPSGGESELLLRSLLANLRLLCSSGALEVDQLETLGLLAVAQLEVGDSIDSETATEYLLPCLSDLADATGGDETLLKPIVRKLCDFCQPDCEKSTRCWSLRALQELANRLTDIFVDSLAADCVPTLAECAEDDDEEIEHLAQEMLRDIEHKAGGEPMEL